ncbi:putative bacteriocin transport accessory protein [Listeria grayi]|uniref:Putative bacteriocin transport accessory protein n=1 Tax=Listeria grayi TaxID=1641 RepID=A0A378PLD7_LISGR|nr:hypothetical protein [Listeria grayi]STY85494.1 putative bacteriocin transport accessory protein [Listeria grayi]
MVVNNLRRLLLSLFVLLISFVLVGCSNANIDTSVSTEKKYIYYVSNFKLLDIKTTKDKVKKGDRFYLYIGRKTCKYCQIFAPKLYKAAKEKRQIIYYLDIDKLDSTDKSSHEFLEHYKIQYVPILIKFNSKHKYKTLDFNSEEVTVKELEKLL